jgi:hypothetical protein
MALACAMLNHYRDKAKNKFYRKKRLLPKGITEVKRTIRHGSLARNQRPPQGLMGAGRNLNRNLLPKGLTRAFLRHS